MNEGTGVSRPRQAGLRRALLAAACGGGSHAAGSSSGTGQRSVQQLYVFAQCMRHPADTACERTLGAGTAPIRGGAAARAVRAAKCMRAHRYPDWPDPGVVNGRLTVPAPPADIDTSSAQFLSTARACGQFLPPGGP